MRKTPRKWGIQRSDGKWITEDDSKKLKVFDSQVKASYEAGQLNDDAEVYYADVTFAAKEIQA